MTFKQPINDALGISNQQQHLIQGQPPSRHSSSKKLKYPSHSTARSTHNLFAPHRSLSTASVSNSFTRCPVQPSLPNSQCIIQSKNESSHKPSPNSVTQAQLSSSTSSDQSSLHITLNNVETYPSHPLTHQLTSPPESSPPTSSAGHRNDKPRHTLKGKSIPRIKRVSSKVFGQLTQSFHSSSDSSHPPSSSKDSYGSKGTPQIVEPSGDRQEDNLFDYDPITHSDTRSFEDDGQEGSLQDALDIADPNTIPGNPLIHDPPPDTQLPVTPIKSHSLTPAQLSPSKPPEPGIQHGALSRPTSFQLLSRMSSSPTKVSSTSPSHHYLSVHSNDSLRRTQPLPTQQKQSLESNLTIIPPGLVPLPSRLSGWFQNAFSSSNSHLPLIGATPSLVPPPSEKLKASPSLKKSQNRTGNSTPPDDHSNRPLHQDSKRSPNGGSHFTSSNMRGLGNFFDKAVNYMFETDAHSYDSRLTADLWIMGGQQFSGVCKLEEVHEERHSEDHLLSLGGNAGTGSGSDASHPNLTQPKKRSGLRRVTVGKTKSIFKHHTNPSNPSHNSPPHSVRKSVDFSKTSCKNINPLLPSSSTPSPEPSFTICHSPRVDYPILLPASITHSYPPIFYHAFASIIGLTYRTDFPPIPCFDRSKSSAIGAAGAKVGGMLASLSLSIGRTSKKPRSGQGGSRSPSPHPHGGEEEDRLSDSVIPKGLTTDVGWGCMLRTGQSLLANALLIAHLGRDWRRPVPSIMDPSHSGPVDPLYSRLLSWFIDSSSPLAPFSVHSFALKGKELGKEVGEWFGPSTAAGAIKALTNAFVPAGLGVATDVDGTVYRSDVYSASQFTDPSVAIASQISSSSKTHWQRPVLVLINARLGLDGVNSAYYGAIKETFNFPQSVGIAGGRPSSSYYFFGYQDDSLFYIDPHHSKSTIHLEEPPASLLLAAQKINLSHRTSFGKHAGDWEHVSSTDTDSVLSGSGCSEALHKVKKKSAGMNADKISFVTGHSSSVSIHLRKVQLDEFYASAYPDSALRTFHPEKVRRMNLSALDPSMLLGFLVKDEADWEDFTARIRLCKPPLFHIADVTPSWMRATLDPIHLRDSVELRPSDDSDLGIDSWSEPEDWGINDHADDMLSSCSHSQKSIAGEHREIGSCEGSSHDEELPVTHADSMGIDDEGWDDVKDGSVNVGSKSLHVTSMHPPGFIEADRTSNSSLYTFSESKRPSRVSPRSAAPLSHVRAFSVNAMHSFLPSIDPLHSLNNPHRHSFSTGDDEGEPAETLNCRDSAVNSNHRTKPVPTKNLLTRVFPTSHQSSISPIRNSQREEPRTRNVSAATVRAARHSEEEHFLADSEETLNHGQRRRLDSQGSSRALRT